MYRRQHFAVCLVVLGALGTSFLPSSSSAADFKVRPIIAFSDPSLDQAKSCIHRKLRSLGDVEVVTLDNFEVAYELTIIIISALVGGKRVGYSATALTTSTLKKSFVVPWLDKSYKDNEDFVNLFTAYKSIENYILFSDKDLESLCTRIVTDFDVNVLENSRQIKRQFEKLRQKYMAK